MGEEQKEEWEMCEEQREEWEWVRSRRKSGNGRGAEGREG
jgi:hypothetical protein